MYFESCIAVKKAISKSKSGIFSDCNGDHKKLCKIARIEQSNYITKVGFTSHYGPSL